MGFIMVNGISYGTGEPVHVTKEEYDALPDSKLTDGQLYLVEDEDENPAANVVGLVDIDDAINGVVLWENPNPSAEFPAQTVTLDDNIEKYDHFEIGLKINKDNLSYYGSIKADLKYGSTQFITFSNEYNYIRSFSIEQSNFIFENAYRRNDYGNISDSLISNNILIPYKIIGYPKADFNSIDGILPSAQNVFYDNATSGLTAENVQDAVDELNGKTKIFHFDTTSQNGVIFIPYTDLPGVTKDYIAAFIQDNYHMYSNKSYSIQRQPERIVVYALHGGAVDDIRYIFDIIFFL